MANKHTLRGLFQDISDAIKEKTGITEVIPATEFPEKIAGITTEGLFVPIVTGTITDIKASNIAGVTFIGENAFAGCDSLISISLPNTVTFIDQNAFSFCPNLKTINVPWAEGKVSPTYAPWGAENATITYNYGGE